MKPIPQNSISHSSKGDRRPSNHQLGFPHTDYTYQTVSPEPAVAGSHGSLATKLAEARTFRSISRRFINDGSVREYQAEALLFAWISLATAWPLYLLVRALANLTIGH
jgi:hypothetical protein